MVIFERYLIKNKTLYEKDPLSSLPCCTHINFLPAGKAKVFEIASQEVNKQCPMTIDEMTRMDSTNYTDGDNTFTYYYTLTGTADDPTIAEATQKQLTESLRKLSKYG